MLAWKFSLVNVMNLSVENVNAVLLYDVTTHGNCVGVTVLQPHILNSCHSVIMDMEEKQTKKLNL